MSSEARAAQNGDHGRQQQGCSDPAIGAAVALWTLSSPPQGSPDADGAGRERQSPSQVGDRHPPGLDERGQVGAERRDRQQHGGHDQRGDALGMQRCGQGCHGEHQQPDQRQRGRQPQVALGGSPAGDGLVDRAGQLDTEQQPEPASHPTQQSVLGHRRLDDQQVGQRDRQQSAHDVEQGQQVGRRPGVGEQNQPGDAQRQGDTDHQSQAGGTPDPGLGGLGWKGPAARSFDRAVRHLLPRCLDGPPAAPPIGNPATRGAPP